MPSPLIPAGELDLARLDRQSLLARLQTLAYQVIPAWSDFSPNFPENVLLEATALLGGMIGSVINERCRQLTIALATDRLAMIRLSKPFGYTMTGATAALVSGTFYLPNSAVATKTITLPQGTRLRSGSIVFSLKTATTIAIGANASASVDVENAEEEVEQFSSDEQPNQIVQLTNTDAIEDSYNRSGAIEVQASDDEYLPTLDGVRVNSFLEAGPDDPVYYPLFDNNGRVYLFFGNGINGKIPQGSITVRYKSGGGEEGRVSAGAVWQVLDTIYDSDGNTVTVKFQNPAASVGGYNATTVDEARVRAPMARRTIERIVNEDDAEYVAGLTAGIARAALITSNQDVSVQEDLAYLYVVAYGTPYSDSSYYPPAAPTSGQMASIQTMVDTESGSYPHIMGTVISVRAATFRNITVAVRIYKESGYTASQVKANITESLQKFFAVADSNRAPNTLIDFGCRLLDADGDPDYKIAWSKVLNAINDTEGVREVAFRSDNLLLNSIRQSVVLTPAEFPLLSTITVYDDDNNGVPI